MLDAAQATLARFISKRIPFTWNLFQKGQGLSFYNVVALLMILEKIQLQKIRRKKSFKNFINNR